AADALARVNEVLSYFEASGYRVLHATALLLQAEALLADRETGQALDAGACALRIAQQRNLPALRYSAHLLLGRVAEESGDTTRAAHAYRAAIATLDRVQRALTITLRPSFLDDKGEALRALITLQLREQQPVRAFETLEHAKSQALLGHVTNRQALRWSTSDPESQSLVWELERLRDRHRWLYKLAQNEGLSSDPSASRVLNEEEALQQLAACEREIRAITERLYLNSSDSEGRRAARIRYKDVQRCLDDETLLIEYYY